MGGLGRMDDRWEDSGMRVGKAYNRGDDSSWGGSRSFEHYAALFERMRESLTKWSQERTEENARDLWKWLGYLDDSSKTEQRTETSRSVGEIGWEEGNDWHPIPVVHQFPPAQPPEFFINASRLRDGEWDTVVGTRIEGFTRWSIDVFPGEETYLHTFVRSFSTSEIVEFFYGSALSLARDLGVDVCSLGLGLSCPVINLLSTTLLIHPIPMDLCLIRLASGRFAPILSAPIAPSVLMLQTFAIA
ncbi:hypothetical protein SISSUDRAFT_475537 [Sistotremastrum suecicum HHB10207 ss-3]|uniref:Uncharacterized protein n=1 Tax=Sistotremastrum suecicum HHB10207 ss-3 TaxID=1314776 RepID=A0A165Y2N6_9AGAM|nr:hypothetical protein SISSUDRAFT_475537 [Sistotremastrum suecicum HHB10207 ss-3]